MTHDPIFLVNLRCFGMRRTDVLGGLAPGIAGGKLSKVSVIVALTLDANTFNSPVLVDGTRSLSISARTLPKIFWSSSCCVHGRELIARSMRVTALHHDVDMV